MISDDGFFFEVKENYGPEMVTAFIRLNGMTVGCVANRTEVLDEENEKTAEYEPVLEQEAAIRRQSSFLSATPLIFRFWPL